MKGNGNALRLPVGNTYLSSSAGLLLILFCPDQEEVLVGVTLVIHTPSQTDLSCCPINAEQTPRISEQTVAQGFLLIWHSSDCKKAALKKNLKKRTQGHNTTVWKIWQKQCISEMMVQPCRSAQRYPQWSQWQLYLNSKFKHFVTQWFYHLGVKQIKTGFLEAEHSKD